MTLSYYMKNNLARLFQVLSDDTARRVFEEVARSRIVSHGQLSEQLSEINEDAIVKSLSKLKGIGLIDRRSAVISEWDRYFITAEGLAAERMLR